MITKRNMAHVYWMLRNLQLILKNLGAYRNHISPHYDTLGQSVSGTQVAEIALDKYHFKGTQPKGEELKALQDRLGAHLPEAAEDDVIAVRHREKEVNKKVAEHLRDRHKKEALEALAIIAHSDIFKRPPWFSFRSSLDHLDRYQWSLPPEHE